METPSILKVTHPSTLVSIVITSPSNTESTVVATPSYKEPQMTPGLRLSRMERKKSEMKKAKQEVFILIIGLALCCKRWVFLVISPCAIHDITWRGSRGNSQQVSEENLATVTVSKSVGISNNSVQSQYRGSRFSDVPVLKLADGAGKLFCVFHLCTPVGGWQSFESSTMKPDSTTNL